MYVIQNLLTVIAKEKIYNHLLAAYEHMDSAMKRRYFVLTGIVLMLWAAIAAIIHITGGEVGDVYRMDLPLAAVGAILVLVGYLLFKDGRSTTEEDRLSKTMVGGRQRDKNKRVRIFISYRKDDSQHIAGRIYDRLTKDFGTESTFKDVDSIPLGADFRKSIEDEVSKCHVLLAVIGAQWLGAESKEGKRRIDDPKDYVRIEIEYALGRSIPVIPLLVQGVTMPTEDELPITLKELAYRNAIPIRADPDFHTDMDRLTKGIKTQ
jgi:hypothetical protein